MKRPNLVLASAAIIMLVGCGRPILVPTLNVTPRFEPTAFGFEVTDEGILVSSNILEFVSKKGSIGARVNGYIIEYLDPSGNPIREGDSVMYSRGSLGVIVPPGLLCIGSTGEIVEPCSVTTPNVIVQYVDRVSEPVSNTVTLPGPIALRVLAGEFVGSRANVQFTATTDLNREVVLGPYEVAVVYPIRGQ